MSGSMSNSDFFLHHLSVGTLFISIILILKVQNGEHVIVRNVWFIMIVCNVPTSCLHSSQLPGKWVIVSSSFREGCRNWVHCLGPHTSENKFSNLLLQIQHSQNWKLFNLSRIRQWRGGGAKLSLTTLQQLLLKLSLTDLDTAGAWHRESGQSFVCWVSEWDTCQAGAKLCSTSWPNTLSHNTMSAFPQPPCSGCWRKQKWGSSPVIGIYPMPEGVIQMSSVG